MKLKIYYRSSLRTGSVRKWRDGELDHDRMDRATNGLARARALL